MNAYLVLVSNPAKMPSKQRVYHEDILLDSFDSFLPGLREGAKAYLTA